MKSKHSIHSLLLLALLALSLGTGCFNSSDCLPSGNCTSLAPTTASLILKTTVNSENSAVPVAIYYGDASDSVLYFTDTLTSERTTYTVPIETRYSAVAKYRRGALTILAVDGGRTNLRTTDDCGDTCYQTDDATLNLKLAD